MQQVALSLNVCGQITPVGKLVSSAKQSMSLLSLENAPYFIEGGMSVKLNYSGDPLPWLMRDAMPDAWGGALVKHRLRQKGIKKPSFSDILMMIGESGAWRFSPQTDSTTNANTIIDWQKTIQQSHQILKGVSLNETMQWLIGSDSLGGARPKFFIDLDEQGNVDYSAEPNQRHWIAKLPSPLDRDDIGVIEYRYNQIARECGISIADFSLIEGKYFATKRFDLLDTGNLYTRTLSGLNKQPHSNSLDNSYESVIHWSMQLFSRNNAEEVVRLALFNRIMGNCDDHAKNISFLCDEHLNWSLAPAYDLTPNAGLGSQAMSLNGSTSPDLDDYKVVCHRYGIGDAWMNEVIYRLKHLDGLPDEDIADIQENIGGLDHYG